MISTRTPLVLRYFIWSMLIFAVSMSLWGFRLLRSLEMQAVRIPIPTWNNLDYRTLKVIENPLMSLPVYGYGSDETYLQIAQAAVHHLKKAGAKTVIVPLPELLPHTSAAKSLIDRMIADSIAVFGVPSPLTSASPRYMYVNRSLDKRSLWWVTHPLYDQQKISWGVLSAYGEFMTPLIRFVPTGFRESKTGAPVPDVIVVALRHYFNIQDNLDTPPNIRRLQIGAYAIPLERDGIAYVRQMYRSEKSSPIAGTMDVAADSIHFFTNDHRFYQTPLREVWNQYNGKLVMVDWAGIRNFAVPSYERMYFQVFGSVLGRTFLRVHQEWNALLITTLVILLSVFSYTMRNGLTIALSFGLFVATTLISMWLFNSHHVLFDPLYVLVPIVLCGMILPIVKTSGEKKLAETVIKGLEEENKRLLELLRRSTHDPRL